MPSPFEFEKVAPLQDESKRRDGLRIALFAAQVLALKAHAPVVATVLAVPVKHLFCKLFSTIESFTFENCLSSEESLDLFFGPIAALEIHVCECLHNSPVFLLLPFGGRT
jgi:hypothetical protein